MTGSCLTFDFDSCSHGSDRDDGARITFADDMTCGICNDKATGLHYGIITCEG
jgi:hypothetical protein